MALLSVDEASTPSKKAAELHVDNDQPTINAIGFSPKRRGIVFMKSSLVAMIANH
jgi:hypothetical protein